MSLATVGADGQPALRTVLLKAFDERGFVFYTNLASRKAQQISENPAVALLFPWLVLERRVAIHGVAERIPTAEALAYFLTRPYGSQLAAWASPQSKVIPARQVLESAWQEIKRKFQGQVPLPSFWGGYRVVPRAIEFWQGRENRLHDRFLYTRLPNGSWRVERLAP
jgi:pyridoxamine 5'-phosphate oxidase